MPACSQFILFILVSKGIYVAYICNFCNLDAWIFVFSCGKHKIPSGLSWGGCYSVTLSSVALIISSLRGLVQLSRSHCRVAVHGPQRLSGITGVWWCFNSKFCIISNGITAKGSLGWREVKCEAVSLSLVTAWGFPTAQKHRLSARTWNRKCWYLRKYIHLKLLEKKEKTPSKQLCLSLV